MVIENEKGRLIKWGISLFITLVLLISGSALFVLSDKDLYSPFQLTSIFKLIETVHPDFHNRGNMISLAQDAVLDELDRYSGLLESRELDRVEEELSGSYAGIGIVVVEHDRGLMIMSVRDDGPAGQAGLRTGDIIIRADSTNLADLTDYQATFLLRGPQDTPLTIKIIRNNMTDTLTFNLIRKQLPLIHIPYAGLTQNKSLYIKIIDFEAGLTDDLKRILDSLYLIDPDNVARIILDLRGNPGGLLREAYRTANCFLDAGHLIVGVKGRSIWRNDEFRSSGHDITANKPIAIIIDKGSASSAEIVAGALKYAGRAILVGDTTFGKGLVQEYTGLGDGSGLRLTTSRYYFEGGIFLNDPEAEVIDSAAGIPPDFYYPFEELEPFPTRLENALLMRDFALENADRIIQYTPFTESEPLWMDEFKTYLKDNGFLYKSTITAIADLAKQLIALGGYQQVYVDAIDRIYQIAQNDDKNQFETYKTYIKQRLYQHALEARFGPMRAYRDAIVPYRGDIHFAETILIEKRNN